MKTTAMLLVAALAWSVPLANALTRESNTDIRVVLPTALPDMARQASNDLLLHYGGDGTAYLYLEQQQGARLVVLNVNDPSDIRVAAAIDTGLAKTYDFVQPVSATLELVRFRDGSGGAILDLRNAKAPRFEKIDISAAEPVRMLGNSGYLAVALQPSPQPVEPGAQDVRVVDTSASINLMDTVVGVTRTAERSETGTIFLIGSSGLTVVRRLDVERQYALNEMINTHN